MVNRWWTCEGSLKIEALTVRPGRSAMPGCQDGAMTGQGGRADVGWGSGHRALVVEDEEQLAGLVVSYLERDGFEVTVTGDGADAVALARRVDPDVIVLDLGLPGLDGVEVCRQVRTFSDAYVVIATARSDEVDTLIGLSVGADDYLTKPFSPRELMARIQAMLRRPRPIGHAPDDQAQTRQFGTLAIDVIGRDVWLAGEPVALTRTEFDILATLAEHPRMAFSRRQLIDHVWGSTWVGDEHLVDVHVGHLRRKLGDDAAEGRYVRTIRGIGYRMGTGE
jgi:DNA-binding response OmpR family regulator